MTHVNKISYISSKPLQKKSNSDSLMKKSVSSKPLQKRVNIDMDFLIDSAPYKTGKHDSYLSEKSINNNQILDSFYVPIETTHKEIIHEKNIKVIKEKLRIYNEKYNIAEKNVKNLKKNQEEDLEKFVIMLKEQDLEKFVIMLNKMPYLSQSLLS